MRPSRAAAKLGDRYITDRFLPDKAVDLIDEASSRVRLQAMLPPPAIREADAQLRKLIAEKEAVVKNQEFDRAASISDREEKLRLEKASSSRNGATAKLRANAFSSDGRQHRRDRRGVDEDPVSRLAQAETEKLLRMGELLHERVVGQDEAINVITRAIRRSRAGLRIRPPDRLVHLPRTDRRRQDGSRAQRGGLLVRR